jgi:hypothetical protein
LEKKQGGMGLWEEAVGASEVTCSDLAAAAERSKEKRTATDGDDDAVLPTAALCL